ncbi:MAG: CARDB domain-containing protein [Desulfobacteraceae bacterium]|jgi:hypothetical protein
MDFTKLICKYVIVGSMMMSWTFVPTAFAKQEKHSFILYPGNPYDTYSLEFPIAIEKVGEIRATAESKYFITGHKKRYWRVLIFKKGEKHPEVSNKRNSPGTIVISHPVDTPELRKGRKYIISVESAKEARIEGTLVIQYPSRAEPQRPKEPCDLVITKIRLDNQCTVVVEVTNKGPGKVPDQVWTSRASASLYFFRNGRSWGGVSLKRMDPERKLQSEGGRKKFRSNIKISGTERIKAVVDYKNRVHETNEDNNAREETLSCGGLTVQPKPPIVPRRD